MSMKSYEVPYGPVYVIHGVHKGRIGFYDDEGYEVPDDADPDSAYGEGSVHVGYVYFGDFLLADGYFIIPLESLREVTTADLMQRREDLIERCGWIAAVRGVGRKPSAKRKAQLLAELHYVESVLVDRMIEARYVHVTQGKTVFISHSSKDKTFATWLGTDLKAAGHTPWFDAWDIQVGESIPQKVAEGLREADFVVVVLSDHAIKSRWVEREWHAKYWTEVEAGLVHVLPVLIRDCTIPELLKTKKYADFRESYNDGLEDVLRAINTLHSSGVVGHLEKNDE